MYHGVPVVGLPLFGEQYDNTANARHRGAGVTVRIGDAKHLAANLERALRTVVADPAYRRAAAAISFRMRAHRRSPVEMAAGVLFVVPDTLFQQVLHAKAGSVGGLSKMQCGQLKY